MNLQAGIDKIDQLKTIFREETHWVFQSMKEVLRAMQSEGDEKDVFSYPQQGDYIRNQIYLMNKRMSEIESKLGGEKKKRIDKIEERIQNAVDRLAIAEKRIEAFHLQLLDHQETSNAHKEEGLIKPEPSSVSECKKQLEAPHTKECIEECRRGKHVTCTCHVPKPTHTPEEYLTCYTCKTQFDVNRWDFCPVCRPPKPSVEKCDTDLENELWSMLAPRVDKGLSRDEVKAIIKLVRGKPQFCNFHDEAQYPLIRAGEGAEGWYPACGEHTERIVKAMGKLALSKEGR